jgi:hypothetical protein
MTTARLPSPARPSRRPLRPPSRGLAVALLCVLSLVSGVTAGVPLPGVAGDGPEKLAADALKRFDAGLSDKDVPELEESLADFDLIYEKVEDKTRKKIHKAYGKLFKLEPRQENREDGTDPQSELLGAYQLAAGTVFDKDGGRQILMSALKLGHIKRWPDATALFVEALGHRVEPENVKVLVGYLDSEDAPVVRAAVEGLGRFAEHDIKLRREAVKPLIKILAELDTAARKEAKKGKREEDQEFLLSVEGVFYEALLELTRRRFESVEEWEDWFAANGAKERW